MDEKSIFSKKDEKSITVVVVTYKSVIYSLEVCKDENY